MFIPNQTIEAEDIIKSVLSELYPNGVFDISEYNRICDIIDTTLITLKTKKEAK